MTTEKIQCEYCSTIVSKKNISIHQRTKKCQKAQEEKRQKEQQSPVKECKESKYEKIECKWCGIKVMSKNMNTHMKSKKCLSIRELKEPSNLYKCKWCKQCFPSHEELSEHRDVCLKGKIHHLKQELYIEKENKEDLIEQHKFELKEQKKEFKKEMREQEEKLRKEMREREQQYEEKLKSKDDFIKTLAKEPKYVTTNNHNTFNLNNYFKGNNGIDFDEKLIENKIEQCKDMMLDTTDTVSYTHLRAHET